MMDHINISRNVIRDEIKALQGALMRIDAKIEQAVHIIIECSGKIITSGLGKSGIIAHKIAATLSSTGTPSIYIHPVDAFHGDLGILQKGDVGLFLSKSGETKEIIDLLIKFKSANLSTIGLIGKKESSIARYCDVFLDCSVEKEACPFNLTPTSSAIVTTALGDALSICLMKQRKFSPENYANFHPAGSLGSRLLLRVKDIMHTNFPKVVEGTSMRGLLIELTSKLLGAVIIINNGGFLKGIYTDGDLKRTMMVKNNFLDCPVENFMSVDPIVIDENKRALEALNTMKEKVISVLPVINCCRKVIGIIHIHDLLNLE